MQTVYQPIVIEECNGIIEILRETNFFEDYQIKTEEFAFDYFCKELTKKFISGELSGDGEFDELFTEEEMDTHLRHIIVGSILHEMQKEGIIDSIEDENNEDRFFLTEKGKQIASKIKK